MENGCVGGDAKACRFFRQVILSDKALQARASLPVACGPAKRQGWLRRHRRDLRCGLEALLQPHGVCQEENLSAVDDNATEATRHKARACALGMQDAC